ncbi:MAG: hypothetical protein GQ538_13235 [Xanthomonadales bacterium]|nr:hypothetical protein [Xanthomonadales bacterium]
MTAYEYLDLAQGSNANALATVSFGFAILCGYLIVAYAAGSKLSRPQVTALTAIYTISFLFNLAGHLAAMSGGIEFTLLGSQMTPELNGRFAAFTTVAPKMPAIMVIIRVSVFIVSLWFMWDVRHPKTK